jgi:cell fate (sporulation/competence/biofilm development) regulator YmcA (YheA/YmcA/DUF963 family)
MKTGSYYHHDADFQQDDADEDELEDASQDDEQDNNAAIECEQTQRRAHSVLQALRQRVAVSYEPFSPNPHITIENGAVDVSSDLAVLDDINSYEENREITEVADSQPDQYSPIQDVDENEGAEEQADNVTVEEILAQSKKSKKQGRNTTQYEKPNADAQEAHKDFDNLAPLDIKPLSNSKFNGRIGMLSDGRNVIVRDGSQEGRATLEIQENNTGQKTKIRYGT